MASSPRGRRPGAPDTRADILAAARVLFADRGFGRTTIRAVAADAGVDPALVHHYFGTKDDLFVASLQLPVDPRERLAPALVGGPDGAAERILGVFLEVWDEPENRLALTGFVRSVLDGPGERLLREGFLPVVLVPVGEGLGIDRPELRMPLVASQVIGLILVRYVLRVEPLASMDAETVVATLAPTIQRYLTGSLPVSGAELT
jgi:AcrR family transcriptional regulator